MELKEKQKLKVSYAGFPDMLDSLFRECMVDTHDERNLHLCLGKS